MEESRLTNPLSVEHLLQVQAHYRSLRESDNFIKELPPKSDWIRWRYLDDDINHKLASVRFEQSPTISIHAYAFDWNDPLLLEGLIRHELLHLVWGASEGHGALFTASEEGWDKFHRYKRQKRRFFSALHSQSGREFSYACANCQRMVHLNRALRPNSACLECCKAFNNGKWCQAYTLIRVGDLP